jgi:hypothetical protein
MAIVCAAYAAQRINSARNGMTSKFGWLQASATKSKPCELHLTTAASEVMFASFHGGCAAQADFLLVIRACLVSRRAVGGIRGSGLTNICGWPVGFAERGFDGMHWS